MEVVDFLLDPWRSGIDRRALIEVILLGTFCGGLGFWVVTERLTYGAESLAHGLLPGLVLAAIASAPLLVGAAGGVAVAAVLIALAARDERIGTDTATAVAVTGLVGLGALLALSPDAPQRLQELLFGDPLGVTDGDIIAAAALAVIGGVVLAALHRPLSAAALGGAPAGVRPGLVRLALLGLLAASVAIAVQGLGALLVLAVLVAPAVAVRPHARSAAGAIRGGAAFGALAGIVGIYVSVHVGVATGASVALALCAAAAVGALVPRRSRGAARVPAATAAAPARRPS